MGLLLYQSISGEIFAAKGEWEKSNLTEVAQYDFFVADSVLFNCYAFTAAEQMPLEACKAELAKLQLHPSKAVKVDQATYLKGLTHFKHEMLEKGIQKAIYSRIEGVESREKPLAVFTNLCSKYKGKALVYLIASDDFGLWIGATPEILLQGDANSLKTVSLAGTKKNKNQEWTSKEVEEQAVVTDFIHAKLAQAGAADLQIGHPETIFSGSVYHLSTKFAFSYPLEDIAQLIQELHPTPAVCGLPRDKALQLINEHEPHKRNFYTGILGYVRPDKVMTFVNLRCMEVSKDSYDLYIGGGITADSVPENEWEETQNKANTLKSVL